MLLAFKRHREKSPYPEQPTLQSLTSHVSNLTTCPNHTFRFKKMSKEQDELSRIDALIAQHDVNLSMPEAQAKQGYSAVPHREKRQAEVPPPWYKCHRCGGTGHFIQDCSVNEDHSILKQVRQARGIPRAFLQAATEEDLKNSGVGGYVSATGELLVMRQASAQDKARITGESELVRLKKAFGSEWDQMKSPLSCHICSDLAKNAVVTACCATLFCRECLLKHLEKTFAVVEDGNRTRQCPSCPQAVQIESIIPDIRTQNLIAQILHGENAILKTPGQQREFTTLVQPGKSQVTGKRKNIEISMTGDEDEVGASMLGLVRVPAGYLNPYLVPGRVFKSEQEFLTWQLAYQKGLKQACLWDNVQEKLIAIRKAEEEAQQ